MSFLLYELTIKINLELILSSKISKQRIYLELES